MKVRVYHLNWARRREDSEIGRKIDALAFGHGDVNLLTVAATILFTKTDNYRLVAIVNTDNINEVFRLTNSINDGWWKNKEVEATPHPTRSTCVGDLYLLEDGSLHIVAPAGLLKVAA